MTKVIDDAARLHPASWHNLRQLVLLHGIKALRCALDKIEQEQHDRQMPPKEGAS